MNSLAGAPVGVWGLYRHLAAHFLIASVLYFRTAVMVVLLAVTCRHYRLLAGHQRHFWQGFGQGSAPMCPTS